MPRTNPAPEAVGASAKKAMSRKKWRRKRPRLARAAHGFQFGDLHGAGQTVDLALVEPARTDLERGRRARRHGRPKRVLGRLAAELGSQERRQEHVAGADRRDRLDAG